jgi:hypothetical protein
LVVNSFLLVSGVVISFSDVLSNRLLYCLFLFCLGFFSSPILQDQMAVLVIKTNQSLLYIDIFTVCSEIRTKQVCTFCGHNVQFLNAEPGSSKELI